MKQEKVTKSDTQKRAMLAALEKSLGIVTNACKQVGISRQTHYRWMQEDEQYTVAVKGLEGMALDFAESKLHEAIFNGNIAGIIFYLKTKGKVRGYVERQEVQIEDFKPDLSGLTNEDIIGLLQGAENDAKSLN